MLDTAVWLEEDLQGLFDNLFLAAFRRLPCLTAQKEEGGTGGAMKPRRAEKKENKEFNKDSVKKLLNDNTPFAVKEAYNSVRTKLCFYDS
jgi:hypothetical protein